MPRAGVPASISEPADRRSGQSFSLLRRTGLKVDLVANTRLIRCPPKSD